MVYLHNIQNGSLNVAYTTLIIQLADIILSANNELIRIDLSIYVIIYLAIFLLYFLKEVELLG